MAGMTWLHLSDWHQKGIDYDMGIVGKKLMEDIRQRKTIDANLEKIDFLIFSGDAAFSGQAAEYKAVIEQLFAPLLEATELSSDKLFIVPGNHDFDEKELEFMPPGILNPFDTERQAQGWLVDDKKRQYLLKPFTTYTQFVSDYTHQIQPAYASVSVFDIEKRKVALFGLNTAMMCRRHKEKGKVNDYGYLILGDHQMSTAFDQVSHADIRFAVLHHPFEWLKEFERIKIKEQLGRECNFILCGHDHLSQVNEIRGTAGHCLIIPAGAGYDRRIAEDPRYTNAYNLVHFDFETQQGTVYLRHWSERARKWLPDIEVYPDGRFAFDFARSNANPLSTSSPSAHQTDATGSSKHEMEQTTESQTGGTHSGDKPPVSRQQSPSSTPPLQQSEAPVIDRNHLRNLLRACLSTIFENIIFSLNPPPGVMSPSNTPQSQRVIELIQWVESTGPGLAKLYDTYLEETGKKKT